MVTHTKEPVVNCRTGKNEKFSKHSFPNAKHQKSDVTIRIKTRDIENHFNNSSVYDKCVIADLLINKVEELPFSSKQFVQSFELASLSVKNNFLEKKKVELNNLATNIDKWIAKCKENITETSSKDILLLLDFILFYPIIPIEFIPTNFRPTDDNNSEFLDYVHKKGKKDEKLIEILNNKHNILEKLFKYYEAVNNLGNFYQENLDMVLIEYFYTPITKFYNPCLALYFTDTKEVDYIIIQDIIIQNSSFVVEDYHVEYLDFCNLYTKFPDPHYNIPIRNHTNGNNYLNIPDDFDANPGDRYVTAIHDMSLRKLGLYKSCPLSSDELCPTHMLDKVKHTMDEFGGLQYYYIYKIRVIFNFYTLNFFETTTLFFRLLEIQKLLMQKVKAVNSVVINTIRYDINDEIFNDIRQRLERKKNELANKFDYLIYMKLFGEKIGVYEEWLEFNETHEDLETKTPEDLISMLCAGCHPDQRGELEKLFEQYEKNKKTEKIEKV